MCPNAASLLRQITFILQLLKPEDALAKTKKQIGGGSSGAPAQKKISVSMVNFTKVDEEAVEISAK